MNTNYIKLLIFILDRINSILNICILFECKK